MKRVWGLWARRFALAAFAVLGLSGALSLRAFLPWYDALPKNPDAYASAAAGGILFVAMAVFPAVPLTLAFPFQLASFVFAVLGGRRDEAPRLGRRWAVWSALGLCLETPAAALMVALVVTGAVALPSPGEVWKQLDENLTIRAGSPAPLAGESAPDAPPASAASPPGPSPSRPTEDSPGETGCARDEDCSPSSMCLSCGQCFSTPPRVHLDCESICRPRVTCRCHQGNCVAAPIRTRPLDAGRVTLAQVNETPCSADSDCAMTTQQCQSGCSGEPVNRRSPLFEAFEEQRLTDDPCCMPGSQCPTTKCAQLRIYPRCEAGRCTLTESPRPGP